MPDLLSTAASYAKDFGLVAGALAPFALALHRYWIGPQLSKAREFFGRVDAAVVSFPSLHKDVSDMKDALGPNGGKSIGAMVIRTDGRLSLLIDSLSTLTWEARSDGQNVRVNRAFEDWCGWSTQDLRGHGWKILLHHDDAHDYVEAWDAAVQDHRPFRYGPVRVVTKDGRIESVYVAANPTSIGADLSYWLGTIDRDVRATQ